MSADLSLTIFVLVVVPPLLFLVMLLPAFLELKKPQDAGPRRIMENVPVVVPRFTLVPLIGSMEESQEFDVGLVQSFAHVLSVLPSLDA